MWFGYNPHIILSHFLSQILSPMDSHGLWRNRFVCHGQLWLVKQNVFSTLGSYGRKKIGFCLLWKVIVGRGTDLSAIDSYVW